MSIQAVAWALDQDLPARPKLVLVSIANHANHTDGYCWLKAETIASEAACKPRSVYRFIGDLIRNGYIRKAPRKGADGKQRANDYWILFNRTEAAWVAVGPVDEEPENLADEEFADGDGAPPEPQDVVEPYDSLTHGETPPPDDTGGTRQDETVHALSHGPTDSGVSRKDIAEPSKTNPEKGLDTGQVPRRYAPPPEPVAPPMGATTASKDFVFAFVGTPAYEAWQKVKQQEIGRPWRQQTTKDGRWGWYFPTLFPPEKPPPDSRAGALATESELDQFSKTG